MHSCNYNVLLSRNKRTQDKLTHWIQASRIHTENGVFWRARTKFAAISRCGFITLPIPFPYTFVAALTTRAVWWPISPVTVNLSCGQHINKQSTKILATENQYQQTSHVGKHQINNPKSRKQSYLDKRLWSIWVHLFQFRIRLRCRHRPWRVVRNNIFACACNNTHRTARTRSNLSTS